METSLSTALPNVSHSTDAIDMPVDPNEPTYCLCNQVSYGEMIGCDNPDVCLISNFSKHLISIMNLVNTSMLF